MWARVLGPLLADFFKPQPILCPLRDHIRSWIWFTQNCAIPLPPERINKLQYVYNNQRTFRKMGVQPFSDEHLLELEANWIEENHTELNAQSGEREDMGDITWIDEVIEIGDTDWVEKDMGKVCWDSNEGTVSLMTVGSPNPR